jgi:hypothetical protein
MSDKKHALYLVKENEGSPKLFAADDVEAAQANGWKQPTFKKSNGTDWNHEDDLDQQDAAAEVGRVRKEAADKKAADQAKEDQKARDAAEKARAEAPVTADLKVEVVTPKKK